LSHDETAKSCLELYSHLFYPQKNHSYEALVANVLSREFQQEKGTKGIISIT